MFYLVYLDWLSMDTSEMYTNASFKHKLMTFINLFSHLEAFQYIFKLV